MITGRDGQAPGAPVALSRFVLVSLVLLCLLFPPETRGESAAGCAALVVLLSLLSLRDVTAGAATALALSLAAAWSLSLAALAPGAAPEPIATLLVAGVVGACAAPRARELRTGEALPTVLTIVAALAALHGLWQVLHGLDATASGIEAAGLPGREAILGRLREGRAFGAFATPAALGGLLAVALPVTLGMALGRSGAGRLGLLAVGGLEVLGLAATSSATAAGALLVSSAVFLARRRGRSRWLVLGIAGAFVAWVAVLVALRGAKIVDPTDPDSPWRLRAGNVRVAAEMTRDHPWTGVGPGGFGESFALYRRPGDNESRHAHSVPFELAAEYGLPVGAALSVCFFVLFLGPLFAREPGGPPWIGGLGVGLGAFAIQNVVDFTATFPSFLWTAAVLRGALARERPADGVRERGLWGPVVFGTAVVAGAVIAGSGLAWNARVEARAVATDEGARAADALALRAVRLAPWDPDSRLVRAEILLASEGAADADRERLRIARDEADAAVGLSPVRPGARALRARVRLLEGDVPGAFADLSEAARLYPMNREYARDRVEVEERLPDVRRAEVAR